MIQEFLRRTAINRLWTFEVGISSFVINVLALGSSLYSIQVLNRYLTLGIDSTLYTLTIGVFIALFFEILLRANRLKLAQKISEIADYRLQTVSISFLGMGQYENVTSLNLGQRREVFSGLSVVSQAYSALNLTSIFDVPFCLVFLFTLYLISPFICGLVAAWIVILSIATLVLQIRMRSTVADVSKENIQSANLQQFYILHPESLRSFNCHQHVQTKWKDQLLAEQNVKLKFQNEQNFMQQITYIGSMFTTIIIYGIGSQQVIMGNLDVGTLIGASILSSRAIGNVNKALQLLDQLVKARHSLQILGALARQPLEKQTGVVPTSLVGKIELSGLGYQYSQQANPVYEGLSLDIVPGTITVFKGKNGMGKTTTAKLLSGLVKPVKGTISIDGVELHQYVPEWWRKQIIYLPQEPGFFQGSLLENLKVLNPEIDDNAVLELCNDLALGEFLNSQEGGLHMQVDASSSGLPPGIRRRLAFVRSLVSKGQIVILDDPFEGVDPQGIQTMMVLFNKLMSEKKTLLIMSNDLSILDAASTIVDLDTSPAPQILKRKIKESDKSEVEQ